MWKILTMDINRKLNSHQMAILLFFLVFTSLENDVLGQCKKNPVNRAVFEGTKDIVMSCAPNPTQVEWRLHPASDELEDAQLNNEQGVIASNAVSAFSLDQNSLKINEATIYEVKYTFSTAGIYMGEYRNKTRLVGAKLLVLRDGPVCAFNVSSPENGVGVLLNCSTTYADHSVHPIRPIITVKLGARVIAAQTLETYRINQYLTVAWLSVGFVYSACVSIEVVLTFDRPTDIAYKTIAKNAPAFSNSVTFPATSETCLKYPGNIAVREGAKNTIIYETRNPATIQWKISPISNELSFFPITDFAKGVFSNVTDLFGANKSGLIIKVATAVAGPGLISTSGLYMIIYQNGEIKGNKVVLVRNGPTCSSSPASSDSVELKCSFEYSDHQLHPIGAYISIKRNGVVISTTTPTRTRKDEFTFVATASTTVSSDASAVDECVIGFNAPLANDEYSNFASNAPDYTDSCNF